jgi:hypothetical protein
MAGFPEFSIDLDTPCGGMWIVTQFTDDRVQLKLYGAQDGGERVIWIKGRVAERQAAVQEPAP